MKQQILFESREMVLVSQCCAGFKCRYRGTGTFKRRVVALGKKHSLVLACPEMLGGLPCPREACDVVNGRVVGRKTGKDYTGAYELGAAKTLELCRRNDIKRAYLLKDSPSCGKGYGITARLLEASGIQVFSI